jgi:hypothetical protein
LRHFSSQQNPVHTSFPHFESLPLIFEQKGDFSKKAATRKNKKWFLLKVVQPTMLHKRIQRGARIPQHLNATQIKAGIASRAATSRAINESARMNVQCLAAGPPQDQSRVASRSHRARTKACVSIGLRKFGSDRHYDAGRQSCSPTYVHTQKSSATIHTNAHKKKYLPQKSRSQININNISEVTHWVQKSRPQLACKRRISFGERFDVTSATLVMIAHSPRGRSN